ncbi:Mbeg1-like protein [Alloscardovia criceti]|uniref:Mbeg1-like protein n=1 Tax=Alloscardovia criceti TaxID=356828 RepID=UPI000369D282|nr:Mbeg1-like protein [Alloscardovia criceti]
MADDTIISYAENMLETFDKVPFNDVDASILAQLAYAQLEGDHVPSLQQTRDAYKQKLEESATPSMKKMWKDLSQAFTRKATQDVSLKDDERFVSLYEAMWRKEAFESIFPSPSTRDMMIELVGALISSPRFREIKVGEFQYEFHEERYNDQQFAAMTFLLPTGEEYIAFRGTETSFVGWREDFELAFHQEIPSQISAVEYVTEVSTHGPADRPLMISGHSKGGNTAVFAASKIPPALQKRISTIYSFDGPGFITDLMDSEGYKRIETKLKKLVPQDSFVGMMFSGREPYEVVHSNAMSFSQHFIYNWLVDIEKRDFVRDESITENALNIANSYVDWTNSLDLETRRRVIDTVFKVFESTGYSSFTELADNITSAAPAMWEAIQNSDSADKEVTMSAFKNLFSMIFGFERPSFHFDDILQNLPFGLGQTFSKAEEETESSEEKSSEEERTHSVETAVVEVAKALSEHSGEQDASENEAESSDSSTSDENDTL